MYEDDVRQIWRRHDTLIKSCARLSPLGWWEFDVFLSPSITDAPSMRIPRSILHRFTSFGARSVPYPPGNVLKCQNTPKCLRKFCYIS